MQRVCVHVAHGNRPAHAGDVHELLQLDTDASVRDSHLKVGEKSIFGRRFKRKCLVSARAGVATRRLQQQESDTKKQILLYDPRSSIFFYFEVGEKSILGRRFERKRLV